MIVVSILKHINDRSSHLGDLGRLHLCNLDPIKGSGVRFSSDDRDLCFHLSWCIPQPFELGKGFIPVRKSGKLPGKTMSQSYELEYGTDQIEIHADAFTRGSKILLVDDLIATGGTAEAAAKLIERSGGEVVECCFVIDLPDLGGTKKLESFGKK